MAPRTQSARRACSTALIAVGALACIGVATCLALLGFLKETASGAARSPIATSDLPGRTARAEAGPAEGATDGADATDEAGEVDWEYWRSVNPHIVAWLHIPGASIDLPVVQASGEDPQFYLSHDVYGGWNPCGCPYVDAGCAEGLDSPNVIVYGHNMGDGSMFGGLVNYRDSNWAQGHRSIELITPEGTRSLTVIGSVTVAGDEERKRVSFDGEDDLNRYLHEKLAACPVLLDGADVQAARMYTLCTCSYYQTPANERTLVYALGDIDETEAS